MTALRKRCLWLSLPFGILAVVCSYLGVLAGPPFQLDIRMLEKVEQKHGRQARQRLTDWQDLIRNDASTTDLEKLEKVNAFFNRVDFIADGLLWKQEDYWATPLEFLMLNGGDCEDFSIAKYFTLKKLGVDEDKLNLTYVKALELNQSHMVVTYFATPEAEPLVLDNLVDDIRPASARSDLLPVFSFNGSGLWLAKERGRGRMVGSSDRYRRWQDLLNRMPEGLN
ncbi:MAG: transglutaminase-like cysteine peptidase [Desulfofustis sp.]|nr:transglutaminase-like cysteine peptidase [Desulfofustis sp.]